MNYYITTFLKKSFFLIVSFFIIIFTILTFGNNFLDSNHSQKKTTTTIDLSKFEWSFNINDKIFKLYAVKTQTPNYTIFGDKENRYLAFDGWTIFEGARFSNKDETFRITKNDNLYKIIQNSSNQKNITNYICDNWIKSKEIKKTIWTQKCKNKSTLTNRIEVDENDQITSIYQQLTPNGKEWVLKHNTKKNLISVNSVYLNILTSLFISFLFSLILVLTFNYHSNLSKDTASGPQKIHHNLTPRIGGISLFSALFIQILLIHDDYFQTYLLILVSSIPVFCSGIAEDITKKINSTWRLMATFLSAFLAIKLLDLKISNTDVIFIDLLLGFSFLTLVFTIFSIAAMTQAINIIDGLHGLSLGTSIIITSTVSYLAFINEDITILLISLIFISSLAGIFILNFPSGKLFIGDGGAYLVGNILGILVILISQRNLEISPLVCCLIVCYPIYELLRSFFRRLISKDSHSFEPDNKHLHSFVYTRLSKICSNKIANPSTTIIILLLPTFTCFWAIFFYANNKLLLCGIFLTIFLYEIIINFTYASDRKIN